MKKRFMMMEIANSLPCTQSTTRSKLHIDTRATAHSTISKRLRLGAVAAALETSMSSSRWRLRTWLCVGDDDGPPALGDDDEVLEPPPPPGPGGPEFVLMMDGPPNEVSIASPGPPSMVSFRSVGSNSIASSASPLVPSRFWRSVG